MIPIEANVADVAQVSKMFQLVQSKFETLKSNSVSHHPGWELSSFASKPLRLHFDLQRGRLWSFRFAGRGFETSKPKVLVKIVAR